MTTVLEALRELERRKGSAQQPVTLSMERPRSIRWWWVALVPLALAGGATGLMLILPVLPRGQTPRSASITTSDTAHEPQVEHGKPPGVPQVAPEKPALVPRLASSAAKNEEVPWARLEKRSSAVPAGARVTLPQGPKTAAPPVRQAAAPPAQEAMPPRLARPRGEPAKLEAGHEPAARDAEARGFFSVSGDPPVEVTSIVYSPDLAKRLVSLRIAGARAVTLHEGESASGVEVQLILRDAVYLRQGGNIFVVGASH